MMVQFAQSARDNPTVNEYALLMESEQPYLSLRLDLKDPIEIADFVDLFASVASQLERHIKREYPDFKSDAKIYIKEIREGSIIAEIIALGGSLIEHMDKALIVLGFASLFSRRVRNYLTGGRDETASKRDVSDFLDTVKAIAKDSDGKSTLETAVFKDGILERTVALVFTGKEAREAVSALERHKSELDAKESADRQRVLMYFKRSDIGSAELGKRSGERVIIEDVSNKDYPLIYASPLAEQRIKDEIRHASDNVFKKGFVVDVNIQKMMGKVVAYAITNVHQIIDLAGDD